MSNKPHNLLLLRWQYEKVKKCCMENGFYTRRRSNVYTTLFERYGRCLDMDFRV